MAKPDDEDGVVYTRFVANAPSIITVNVESAAGKLDAWIDWNRDGDWSDAGEQVATSRDVIVGPNFINTFVPSIATTGTNMARFRLSTAGGLMPTGAAPDGEVEDHSILITATANPFAVGDTVHGIRDIQLIIPKSTILVNDADGDILTASPFTSTIKGGLVMPSGDSILYTPPTGFIGVDEFEYSLNDPFGGSAMGRVEVLVSGTAAVRFQELDLMPMSVGNDVDTNFAGEASVQYLVQVSSDLSTWTTAATITSGSNGAINFLDSNAKAMPRRYYRILRPANP
ncbi:MAG: Ig-like domain-containing protein [Limisphaerales bacterium]